MSDLRTLPGDISEMIDLSRKLGEMRVLYMQAAEIKRGKMPDEKRLAAFREKEKQAFDRLEYLKRHWGIP